MTYLKNLISRWLALDVVQRVLLGESDRIDVLERLVVDLSERAFDLEQRPQIVSADLDGLLPWETAEAEIVADVDSAE